MTLDANSCYRALVARDARFDGVFFVGVVTTGIYCRPLCPARTPRRDRCRFFPSAAAAEQATFRPCLRCRPELAPGNAPTDSAGRLARLAAARIGAGAVNDEGSVETLAAELGVCSRQLRRVVRQELGVSPVELAQTHRLLLAKQLLTETRLPIIEVAFASGFASVRRFNATFREHYRLAPRDLRKRPAPGAVAGPLRLTLSYRPPFAWEAVIRFLAGRALPGVEMVSDQSYLRTVALNGERGWVRVTPSPAGNALAVEVATPLAGVLPRLLAKLRHLFDLDARPDVIDGQLAADRRIGPLVRNCPGLRVPGAFDGFELALRAVLGQQVSVKAATTFAGRLADAFGEPVETPFPALRRLSPTPARIASARVGQLTALGLVTARAECVLALARAVSEGRLSLEPGPDPEGVAAQLTELPGIGPWTGHYIAMRALRWPDAFPHTDLGLRKKLNEKSPKKVLELAEAWRPWRAYAALHLWTANDIADK